MKKVHQLFFVIAVVFATVGSAAASTDRALPEETPKLVVYARTDIPAQGAPTLDLTDLERYFVNQLEKRRFENVFSSQTARPTGRNAYLAELSIEAIHLAERPAWSVSYQRYQTETIFGVDLSLTLKHLASGKVLGSTQSRLERKFETSRGELDIAGKRAVIYKAADILADRLAAATFSGDFGSEAALLMQPLPVPLRLMANLRTSLGFEPLYVLAGLEALLLIILIKVMVRERNLKLARERQRQAEWRQSKADLDQFQEAIALKPATHNFSDEACRAAAGAGREQILEHAAEMQEAEASRRANIKAKEAEYERIGALAVSISNSTKEDAIRVLRQSDEWEYRVLQAAQDQGGSREE